MAGGMTTGTGAPVTVREVDPACATEVGRFIEFPFDLYRGVDRWTPPLKMEMRRLMDPQRNAYFRHSQAGFFLAERADRVVGRIAALRQRFYNEKYQNDTAFFYWFEAVDDQTVADALFAEAEAWARARGVRRMLGPIGFIQPDPPGILVRGFEHEGTVNVPWHFPYYERLVETARFVPHTDYLSGYFDRSFAVPPELLEHADRAMAKWGYTVRGFRTKKEMWGWAERFFDSYLEAFAQVPDFYPMSPEEYERLADDMITLAEPATMKVLAQGEEVLGFLLAIRDITPGLRRARGRLLPFGWWHLLWSLHTSRQCNVIALGVRPQHQKGGANLALFASLIRTLQALQIDRTEIVQVVGANLSTTGDMTRLGAKWDKCHRVYRREFAVTAAVPAP
jgi:hypothetical protein